MNVSRNLKCILFACGLLFGSCVFSQSNISSVEVSTHNNEVKVVKNIEKGEIQLQIEGAKDDQGLITISNQSGKVLVQQEMELNPTTSYFTFKTAGFESGKYLINIKSKLDTISKELIIK